ncbi:MAG: IclR family transcriptional regulator [Firmicutes bacterium]|nr:IclR family transcriptional regulator [Bacillota bacterium]
MRDTDDAAERMKSLDRGLKVLELLSSHPHGLKLTDLAQVSGEKVSTLHHVLSALKRRHFVAQDPRTREYRLGVAAWRVGRAAMVAVGFVDVAHAELLRTAQSLGETMTLAVREGFSVVYVDQVLAPRSIKMSVTVGDRAPMHCTASGKVFMAAMSEEEFGELLRQPLARYTANTMVEASRLRAERESVRDRGYAIDCEEREEGLCCVAAPVRDHLGAVVAAISLSGPRERLDPTRIEREIVPAVLDAARRVSLNLGYRPLTG